MATTVEALLNDIRLLGEEQFEIVAQVRAVTKKAVHPLTEGVKYGGIVFSSGRPFGGVFAYKDHVSVEFSHGARIPDPHGFLEGNGKGRRHIKLRSAADIESKKLAVYVQLAVEAAASGA